MNAKFCGMKWQVEDGPDLVEIWLASDGLHSIRITNHKTKPRKHAELIKKHTDLILFAEGQGKLL